MASTEYERDKYLGRIHGKNQFTLVGDTLNAPNVNSTSVTASSHVSASNFYGTQATLDTLQLNTGVTYVDPDVGEIIYDDAEGTYTLGLKGGNIHLHVGEQEVQRVRNVDSVDFTVGMVVYVSGSSGQRVASKRAIANSDITSATVLGVVAEPINQNQTGFVTTSGLVSGVNTNSFNEGDLIYLSPTVSGSLINTKPVAPDHLVFVGYVVKKNVNGSLFVHMQNGYEIGELHDVYVNGVTNNQVLQYVSANTRWENKTLTTSSVSGLGTAAGLASDTDGTLAANSDLRIATQKATKTYADTKVAKAGDTMTGPLVISSSATITGSAIITGSITTQTQLDFDAVTDPSAPLTVALAGVAGNVNVGFHYYFVSFVTALGETAFWAQTLASVTTTAGNQQVLISNIPVSPDPRVTARRLYRTGANQNYFNDVRILATINNNTDTTYTDNIADASRTGAANYFFRENTTCRYITKDGVAASFIGVNCTSFGQGALQTLNAGTHTGGTNTCVGRNAGYILSTGDQNIIISNSATGVSTGTSNVLIHGNWGNNPSSCVMIGRNAGAQNSGANNVAIGVAAAGSTGHNNGISIGLSANANVTGQGCVAVGTNAGSYSATSAGAFNINIGSGARSPVSGSSGQINIGNVIYGVNAYQSTTATSTPTTTGRIGIGLETPTARLHLPAGTAPASGAPLKFTSGSLMTSPEDGSIEFNGDKIFLTITSSAARKEFTLNDASLTSGSIPVATTNGRLATSNIYSVYNTGTTAGTASSTVSLKVLTFTTNNEFRFLRLAVRATYPTGGEAFARTINAAWGSGSMGMMQVGSDELGTLMYSGTKLDGATIQTSGSGADIYVKCTDVEGAGGTTTWVVAGEYF